MRPTETAPETAEDAPGATIDLEGLRAQARLASAQGVLLWALVEALQPRARDSITPALKEKQADWAVRDCVRRAREVDPRLEQP